MESWRKFVISFSYCSYCNVNKIILLHVFLTDRTESVASSWSSYDQNVQFHQKLYVVQVANC